MPDSRSDSSSFEVEVFAKLKEAEIEAKSTVKRYTHHEVLLDLRLKVASNLQNDNHS